MVICLAVCDGVLFSTKNTNIMKAQVAAIHHVCLQAE